MDLNRNVNGKILRCGCTTGTCAAAAAKAAALHLFSGLPQSDVTVRTPKGILLTLSVENTCMQGNLASAACRKDAGDDPDVTHGILIFAAVKKTDGPAGSVRITGGKGVGRITRPGLDQPVGAAAINSVPRLMITEAVQEAAGDWDYSGGLEVEISIPAGEELAKRTFNPYLGIEGGLSVIGTSGIVEPMSNQALIDTIRLEIRQLQVKGKTSLLLTPGNYGETFARDVLSIPDDAHINCANFIGDSIDAAVEAGFRRILLVGHIGKLVKLAIGCTNTHSAFCDGRMEALIALALAAGAEAPLLRELALCVSTDAALPLLAEASLLAPTMERLGQRIGSTLARRVPDGVEIGFFCFTKAAPYAGVLCQSENAAALLSALQTL